MLGPEFPLIRSGPHNSSRRWFCSGFGQVVTEKVTAHDVGYRWTSPTLGPIRLDNRALSNSSIHSIVITLFYKITTLQNSISYAPNNSSKSIHTAAPNSIITQSTVSKPPHAPSVSQQAANGPAHLSARPPAEHTERVRIDQEKVSQEGEGAPE